MSPRRKRAVLQDWCGADQKRLALIRTVIQSGPVSFRICQQFGKLEFPLHQYRIQQNDRDQSITFTDRQLLAIRGECDRDHPVIEVQFLKERFLSQHGLKRDGAVLAARSNQ